MASTLTTSAPHGRGDVLGIDVGPDCELVKVTHCFGISRSQFLVTVRPYRWYDHAWDAVRAYWRRALAPLRDWRYERCDTPRCLRAAVLETSDYDAYCAKHAPAGAHAMEDDE